MLKWAVLLWAVVGFGVSADADTIDPAKLRHDLSGSVVALRQPLRGAEIVFRSDGEPEPPLQRGTFARDALLRIDDVRLDGARLQLSCRRDPDDSCERERFGILPHAGEDEDLHQPSVERRPSCTPRVGFCLSQQ